MIARQFLIGCVLCGIADLTLANNDISDLNSPLQHVESSIIRVQAQKQAEAQNLRDGAISRAAKVYGAQSGYYYRWQQLEALLFKRTQMLTRIFNFGSLYLDEGRVQPPILDRSRDALRISNLGQTRQWVDTVYRVLLPASFKPRSLTWQSYLIVDQLHQPSSPRVVLLPRNDHEKTLWHQGIQAGWQKGIQQANSEFNVRLDALNNAFQGMVLYTMLAMQGMIQPPHIQKVYQDTLTSSDRQKMAVGVHDEVIAKKSYLVARPNRWKPVYYRHRFILDGKDL